MKKNEQGASLVEGLLIVVIVGLIGFVGWYVWHANQTASDTLSSASSASPKFGSSNIKSFDDCKKAAGSKLLETFPEQCVTKAGKSFTQPTSSAVDPYNGWLSYSGKLGNISLKYPEGWTVKRNDSHADPQASPDEVFQLQSPNGLNFMYVFSQYDSNIGAPSDYYACGHQSACSTYQVNSITSFDSGTRFGKMYIVEEGNTVPGFDGNNGYEINLYQPLKASDLPKVGSNSQAYQQYSFVFSDPAQDSYHIYVDLPDSATSQPPSTAFSSEDVKTALLIMQSFRAN